MSGCCQRLKEFINPPPLGVRILKWVLPLIPIDIVNSTYRFMMIIHIINGFSDKNVEILQMK